MAYRYWDVNQIREIWVRNGGRNDFTVVIPLAVALAESGGNQFAVSPSGDYGLWQINESNFANLGVNYQTIFDNDVNARCAIRMSGNGTNWAAWCTCWTDPARDCGHGSLLWPQPGSPADLQEHNVAVQTSLPVATNTGHGQAKSETEVIDAWGAFTSMLGGWGRARDKGFRDVAAQIERLIQ